MRSLRRTRRTRRKKLQTANRAHHAARLGPSSPFECGKTFASFVVTLKFRSRSVRAVHAALRRRKLEVQVLAGAPISIPGDRAPPSLSIEEEAVTVAQESEFLAVNQKIRVRLPAVTPSQARAMPKQSRRRTATPLLPGVRVRARAPISRRPQMQRAERLAFHASPSRCESGCGCQSF